MRNNKMTPTEERLVRAQIKQYLARVQRQHEQFQATRQGGQLGAKK